MKQDDPHRKRDRSFKQRIENIPLTPMIDVVFQLLIFFVFTFELPDRLTEMPVTRSQGPGTGGVQQDTITIDPEQMGESPFRLNDRGVSLASLHTYLFTVAEHDPSQTLIVKARADSKHKHLVAVLNLMSDAGLENIRLLSAK